MCAVSMVSDHFRDKWPQPVMPLHPLQPFGQPLTRPVIRVISEEEWAEYQALKRKAVEYDIATHQPDCAKPDVDEWENDIEAFLILMGWITEETGSQE